MTIQNPTERVGRRRALLDELIREKGIERYGLFAVTTEGKVLPDGSESASGLVVDPTGRVHAFWLDWDEARRRVAFVRWNPVQPRRDWETDDEYRAARRAAGLASQ
jgi:hypothetical protein